METQLPMLFMQNISATCWIYVGSTRVRQGPGFAVFVGTRQDPGFPVFVGSRQGPGFPVFVESRQGPGFPISVGSCQGPGFPVSVGSRQGPGFPVFVGSRFSGFCRLPLGSWVPVFRYADGNYYPQVFLKVCKYI